MQKREKVLTVCGQGLFMNNGSGENVYKRVYGENIVGSIQKSSVKRYN